MPTGRNPLRWLRTSKAGGELALGLVHLLQLSLRTSGFLPPPPSHPHRASGFSRTRPRGPSRSVCATSPTVGFGDPQGCPLPAAPVTLRGTYWAQAAAPLHAQRAVSCLCGFRSRAVRKSLPQPPQRAELGCESGRDNGQARHPGRKLLSNPLVPDRTGYWEPTECRVTRTVSLAAFPSCRKGPSFLSL